MLAFVCTKKFKIKTNSFFPFSSTLSVRSLFLILCLFFLICVSHIYFDCDAHFKDFTIAKCLLPIRTILCGYFVCVRIGMVLFGSLFSSVHAWSNGIYCLWHATLLFTFVFQTLKYTHVHTKARAHAHNEQDETTTMMAEKKITMEKTKILK